MRRGVSYRTELTACGDAINHKREATISMRITPYFFMFGFVAMTYGSQQPQRLPKILVKDSALSDMKPLDNADITHITERDIEEQQFVTLSDALRRVPGAYVTQSGGIGQESRISIRGTGGQNTTVIVNGMPINDSGSFDNAFNISRWTLDDVSDIQVVHGPMSSLYGPGGMGGVLLIDTKTGHGPHKNFAKLEGGSFSTYMQTAGMQGQKQLMDYYLIGSRIQSAGPSTTPKRYMSALQDKLNDPLNQESINARFGFGQESSHISLVTRYQSRRLGFRRHPHDINPFRQNFSESFNRLQGHFETSSGTWIHDLGLGYYLNDLQESRPVTSIVKRNASQAQIDWRQSYQIIPQLQIQIAMDCARESLFWYNAPDLDNSFSVSYGGLGAALTHKPAEKIELTGSVRMDKYQGIPNTTTYRLGGSFGIEEVIIKGGIGTAFKAPTLQQKFYKSSRFVGNPNLKPVRSMGWDLGVERSFINKKLSIGMTVFQNHIHDLITGSTNHNTLINMDKSTSQGIEGLVKFRPTSLWVIELTHTYTDAKNQKTGQELTGNPRNKTTVCITKQATPAWFVSANVLYVSPRYTDDAVSYKRVRTPSYTILGAETYYQLNDQWQAYARGENILNRQYESPQSLQQPGLGVYVGLRAQC